MIAIQYHDLFSDLLSLKHPVTVCIKYLAVMKRQMARGWGLWMAIMLVWHFMYGQHVGPVKVNPDNARSYRDSAKLKIFGTTAFPYDWMPDEVHTDVSTLENYDGFAYTSIKYPNGNLESVDQLDVLPSSYPSDFPVQVHSFVFHPHLSNGKLFIYHSGHCAAIATTEDVFTNNNNVEPGLVIPRLIAEGYTVLAVPMINYKTTPPNFYTCGFNNHNRLFSDGHYSFPLSLFFKPLISSLNYLNRSSFTEIYMCGLSGGGWVTSVYPAIDSSIVYSFPIAGAWPKAVRNLYYPSGDYEQTYPPLFNMLDTHELLTLGCLAPPRHVLQINNRYDNCCFGGVNGHLYYVDSIKKSLAGTGGVFDFYLDETVPNHQVAPHTVDIMLEFISHGPSFLQTLPGDTVTASVPYQFNISEAFPHSIFEVLHYSLLKAPEWLQLDSFSGILSGTPPPVPITGRSDTVSFKVEDSHNHFSIYNYILTEKRALVVLFTAGSDLKTVYAIPSFSHSLSVIENGTAAYFHTASGAIVDSVTISNGSLLVLHLNQPVSQPDYISYNGEGQPNRILFNSGLPMDNFVQVEVNQDLIKPNMAEKGMIRFNTDTRKFEYFNGSSWINMN